MFSLFPSQWSQPVPRRHPPDPNQSDNLFQKAAKAPVPKIVKVINPIPISEMCIGENNDFAEVDKMLAEINNPSPESKNKQILHMIQDINEQLSVYINVLKNNPAVYGDTVGRNDLLKLMLTFKDFCHSLEGYLKENITSSF